MKLQNKSYLLIIIGFFFLVFTRFYNLERNFKFNRDESSDLVKMHQYWVDKKISLIGPISEDGNLVYSSFSYYLEMPFAILFKFKAVSPTMGNAFWSVMTALVMFIWLYFKNKRIGFLDYLLIVVWYPLLIISRWAWNPNLIPLMMILGVILVENKGRLFQFVGGIFLGLSGHLHYLGLISSGILGLFKSKNIFFVLGFLIPIGVFIAFDLTHLPGLFITRVFLFKQGQIGINLMAFLVFYKYIIGSLAGLFFCILLIIDDIHNERKIIVYWISIIFLTMAVCLIKNPQEHYFIPTIIPFWMWLSIKRKGNGYLFKILLTTLLIVTSFTNSYNLIFGKIPDDSAYSAQEITSVISSNIIQNKLINANIAVLQSTDINSFGVKYRDLLLVNGIKIKDKESFETTDNLYVITQNNNIDTLRADPSVQMNYFKNGPVSLQKQILGTSWWVFRFDKY